MPKPIFSHPSGGYDDGWWVWQIEIGWQQFNGACQSHNTFEMEGSFNIDSLFKFLQTACKSKKDMEAIKLDALAQASDHMPLLTKLNDKGLLILMIAKIIAQKFADFPQVLKLFQAELFPVERTVRVRRQQNEEGEKKRRKKRVRQARDVDLNQLSNQSIINPAGVMPPVVGEIRGRAGQADEASKGSKPSQEGERVEPPLDSNFPQVFTEMEQQLAAEREINPEQSDNSQTTSSNSNLSRFGAIANFNKKMEILGEVKLQDRTVRRPRAPPGAGRRTRRKDPVVDANIDLDQTGPSVNEALDVTVEAVRTRHTHLEEYALFKEFKENVQEVADRIRSNIFSEANKLKLLRFGRKVRPDQRPYQEPETVNEMTDYTEQTSYLPQSTMFEQPDSTYREHLDSNIFHGDEKLTLIDLQRRVNKPKWEVFQNLLWLSQHGEVRLEQQHPERFGQIVVIRQRRDY